MKRNAISISFCFTVPTIFFQKSIKSKVLDYKKQNYMIFVHTRNEIQKGEY